MTIYLKNYYSSIQQYSELASTAFNEGPLPPTNTIGVNSSSINTSEIDAFRQGVEITQNKHTLGFFKISAGTPGHIIKPVCFGENADISIVSTKYFVEISKFDAVEYVLLPTSELREKMISGREETLTREQAYNGVIEPLTIRAVEGFMSTEAQMPFQLHAIKGELSTGNASQLTTAADQILTVDEVPKKLVAINAARGFVQGNIGFENKSPFYDRAHANALPPGSGSISGMVKKTLPINGSVKYFLTDLSGSNIFPNTIFPFDDSQVYLQKLGITTSTHGADMISVFTTMTGSTGNYVPPGHKSATTGFVFDNTGASGVDSIAFGGLTY